MIFNFCFLPRDTWADRQRSHFLRSSAGAWGRLVVLHWGLVQLQGVALVINVVVTPLLAFGGTDGGPDQGHTGLEVGGFARVRAVPEQAVVVDNLGGSCGQRS